MWSRPCDGHPLQVLWRLALNGIPTAERDQSLLLKPCGCNLTIGITRTHLYHECAIVKPTWLSVQTRLCGEFSIPAPGLLQRQHIWMAVKPHPQLHQGIWDIVALNLLAAFNSGRRNWMDRIIKLQSAAADVAQGGHSGQRQNRSTRTNGSVHRPKLAPGPKMIAVVSQVVLTEFWARIGEVANSGTLPNAWLSVVPLNHPFLQPDTTRSCWVVSDANV